MADPNKPLRVAVVGVGHLGRHHARILAALPGVELVAVVDTNRARAEEIAAGVGSTAMYDPAGLIGRVDAVSVAVPTTWHLDVAKPLLERGIHVLVEKPMARSLEEADEMIAAAEQGKALLGVGHTERFNPAVEAARSLLIDPRFIEVHRLGTLPERSLDIDVVFDLMIHDIDVVLSLVKSPVESIEAVGVPVLTGRVDIANVRIRFENGCIANLTASRISRDRIRKIRFFQQARPAAYVSIDYAAQKVEVLGVERGVGPMPAIKGGELPVVTDEPLKRELADFVEAIRHNRPPAVDGHQGRRALELAQQIVDRMASDLRLRALINAGPPASPHA